MADEQREARQRHKEKLRRAAALERLGRAREAAATYEGAIALRAAPAAARDAALKALEALVAKANAAGKKEAGSTEAGGGGPEGSDEVAALAEALDRARLARLGGAGEVGGALARPPTERPSDRSTPAYLR